ncbi:uncharacterized protein LOC116020393 [Ipomoea triloba]|uniref:uncharacterized protein LOC116020393 n=1 Tax=Ipomoea triloba TaxID=35885 RepID=UPI00125D97AD|nr:uncharacterized protein LOC116020393 [Ipomoea triloba]
MSYVNIILDTEDDNVEETPLNYDMQFNSMEILLSMKRRTKFDTQEEFRLAIDIFQSALNIGRLAIDIFQSALNIGNTAIDIFQSALNIGNTCSIMKPREYMLQNTCSIMKPREYMLHHKDLGLDSLDNVEIIMALEEEFKLEIPDKEADKIGSCALAIEYISNHPMAG